MNVLLYQINVVLIIIIIIKHMQLFVVIMGVMLEYCNPSTCPLTRGKAKTLRRASDSQY